MSAVGQPAWRTGDVIAAQQALPLCRVCAAPAHLPPIDGDTAISLAQRHFRIGREDLLSHRRFEEIVEARAFVVWCLRQLGRPWGYSAIGRMLERDHSSILYLHQKSILMWERDDRFRAACDQVEQNFYSTRIHRHAY